MRPRRRSSAAAGDGGRPSTERASVLTFSALPPKIRATDAGSPGSALRRAPRFLAIGDLSTLGGEAAWPRWIDRLATAGVDALQVREKAMSDRDLHRLVERTVRHAAGRLRVVVNGRADIALAADADGVHLPSTGVPVAALRDLDLVIGRSCHSIAEVEQAASEGADYVTFGPLHPTPSKRGAGPPPGPGGLRRAAAVGLPVLALGGVTSTDAMALAAACGAAGVAGIRAFQTDGLASFVAAGRACFAEATG